MIINDPETLAEVTALFETYEKALVTNDVPVLDGFFRDAPETIRYGARENLYGYEEIRAFRAARPGQGVERTLERRCSAARTQPGSAGRCRRGCVSRRAGRSSPRM
jgi:hypothetical protein